MEGAESEPVPSRRLGPIDWEVVARRGELAGELRANLLRIIGVAVFYGVELLNFHGLSLGPLEFPRVAGVDARFHLAITALCATWVLGSAGVIVALRSRIFPPALKYVTTGADALLMTGILLVADGPRSPLVVALPLLVALAGLRLRLRLVHFATLASTGAYLVLLGNAAWYRTTLRVPRYQQALVLLAIVFTGVALDQIVRRSRKVAEELLERTRPS